MRVYMRHQFNNIISIFKQFQSFITRFGIKFNKLT